MEMTQGTMNIDRFDLGGNPSNLGVEFNDPLHIDGNVNLNLSGGSAVYAYVDAGHAAVDVRGDDNMFLRVDPGTSATVDLRANARWIGSFYVFPGATVLINGAPHAAFINQHAGATGSGVVNGAGAKAIIMANITGNSPMNVLNDGALEVGGSVSSGQTLVLGTYPAVPGNQPGFLQVDHPTEFDGLVRLAVGEIDLNGLARADSYSYQNDMLSIWSGNSVINTLRLQQIEAAQGTGLQPFAVEKTATGVSIYTESNPTHPPGTALPLHG